MVGVRVSHSLNACAAILAKALTGPHESRETKLQGAVMRLGFAAALAVFVLCGAAQAQTHTAAPAPALAAPADATTRTLAHDIYQHIIGMDTSVEGHRVPEMAAYLASLFRDAGFPAGDIHILPLGQTASFVVRYRGDGSGGRPIVLMAHMDVVTAHRADWQRDPYTLVEENGYFFGRGTADIKNGVAILSATLLRLKAEHFTPTRDLILYFSGDEETSGATTIAALRDHRDLLDAEFALNSDAGGGSLSEDTNAPQLYTFQAAEKTFASFTLTAHNPGGHSSQPRPDNAIYDIADALERVRAYQFPVMWNDITITSFRLGAAATPAPIGPAMAAFARHPGDRRATAILSASPFFVGQVRTTCIPTLIQGGHADNALPQSVVATVNCRIFPGVAINAVQAQIQRLAGAEIAVAPLDTYYSSDASPLRDDVAAAVTDAVHARHPGVPIIPSMAAGASDGVFFRAAGIPTYGVGETFIKESDDFSHGLNERIPVQSFYDGLVHWRVMIMDLAGRRS
jgi:acetylornithine deacetylase/succinyl-diaminopimelate desuccinylase-like protein